MRNISELTVLSRVTVELPDDSKIATEAFQEGWNFVQSGDLHWLDKRIRKCGWHFIWIAEPSLRSGVGQTAQAAIAGALKLALRRVSPDFNTANIDHIELKQYPWFIIAKVRVYPYQIQKNAVLQVSHGAIPMPLPMTAPAEQVLGTGSLAAPAV